ncbi:MAG: hypothetical protein NW226_23645 [Microscillaceae bacterium]|nr:hypothetical protein [Microscillaceae bacterium]
MKTIQNLFIYCSLIIFTLACKEDTPTPTDDPPTQFIATWAPGTVLLNNTGSNLAENGQPYASFRLVLNGDDNGGTYTLSGVPAPYQDANGSGNWSKTSNSIQLQSVPSSNGFKNLLSAQISGGQLKFQVNVLDPKTGNVDLYFSLVK